MSDKYCANPESYEDTVIMAAFGVVLKRRIYPNNASRSDEYIGFDSNLPKDSKDSQKVIFWDNEAEARNMLRAYLKEKRKL